MRLKDKDFQEAAAGLPASYREWWDIDNGYEIYISIGAEVCSLSVDGPGKKNITYKVAELLGLDISEKRLVKRYTGNEELYLSMGIDCVVLNYTKPESYKALLARIEVIIKEHFKKEG